MARHAEDHSGNRLASGVDASAKTQGRLSEIVLADTKPGACTPGPADPGSACTNELRGAI